MNPLSIGRSFLLGAALSVATLTSTNAACLSGINLAGAEFGSATSRYGTDYIYPSKKTVEYFAEKGFNAVRLPFRWERLQPSLKGPLDRAELERIEQSVKLFRANGMTTILDPHNFARYNENVIGGPAVSSADLADFWGRLARRFANEPDVMFGLMNEPFDIAPEQWLLSANASIKKIRSTGAKNLILVPGVLWTGAHSWKAEVDGQSNAQTMKKIRDPKDNFAFELHQYLDEDFSGSHASCSRAADAAAAIHATTKWLRDNGFRGFLGEFGGSATPECLAGLTDMRQALADADDVWIGWTYWAAGDWWSPEEPMNIQPTAAGDRPQLQALMSGSKKSEDTCPALDEAGRR